MNADKRGCLERYSVLYAESVEREIQTPKEKSGATTLDELAASQGVHPVMEFDSLLGHPSAEDESIEEFSAMLREWRRECGTPVRQR